MSGETVKRFYATAARRLIWIALSLALMRATWFYVDNRMYVAAFITILWLAFSLSWVVNLFRVPIATATEGSVILLERLRFGRPNFLVMRAGEVCGVEARPRGRIEVGLGPEMGERTVSLKYLSSRDRAAVIEALRRLCDRAPAPPAPD